MAIASRRSLLSLALAVMVGVSTLPASAQPAVPSASGQQALAEQLFQEAKRLLEAGKTSEACPKFAESQRLDPGGGTLMNLARCLRLDGKLASAWAAFVEARGVARREGRPERADEAEQQIHELLPLLPHVTILVPPEVAALRGFQLTQNGSVLGPAAIGTATAVDPGLQRVEAKAEGYESVAIEVTLEGPSVAKTVTIPPLRKLPEPVRPIVQVSPLPRRVETGMHPIRISGIAIGSVGLAGAILGAAAGGIALSKQSEANEICPGTVCGQDAVDLNGEARTAAALANVGIFGGAALVGLGVILIVVSPSHAKSTLVAAPGGFAFAF